MWIITKDNGVFNTDRIKHISATCNGRVCTEDGKIISNDLSALSAIMYGIKHNYNYVEVD